MKYSSTVPSRSSSAAIRRVCTRARFAGSGRFRYELPGDGLVELAVDDCPACRGLVTQHPVCGYYTGIFERLFRMLVDDRMRVREAGCHACDGGNCVLLGKPEVEQGY